MAQIESRQDNKKHVLIVSQHFWPESFHINDICDFLVGDKDRQVDVLCGRPNYPSGKLALGYSLFNKRHEVHNKINIYRTFEIPRGNNSSVRILLNYLSFPLASLFHIPRLLFRKYDKIFIYETSPVYMALAGIILGKLTKTEVIIYVLDLWPENLFSVLKVKNRLLRRIAYSTSEWHYKKADRLIALSNRMAERLQDITHKKQGDIVTIQQVCEKVLETNIKDKNLTKRFGSGFNIVFTGNISPAQSFETIISAATKLKSDGISDINWIVVGDGMSKKWLEGQVAQEGLSDHFFFEGQKPLSDIPKYTEIADLLIACLEKSDLLEATIPAKVTSYIAAGRPIVLAMDGEVRDLINVKIQCGFAGQAKNSDELANNIKKVYQMSDTSRVKLGKKALEYRKKFLQRDVVYEQLDNFIFSRSDKDRL